MSTQGANHIPAKVVLPLFEGLKFITYFKSCVLKHLHVSAP